MWTRCTCGIICTRKDRCFKIIDFFPNTLYMLTKNKPDYYWYFARMIPISTAYLMYLFSFLVSSHLLQSFFFHLSTLQLDTFDNICGHPHLSKFDLLLYIERRYYLQPPKKTWINICVILNGPGRSLVRVIEFHFTSQSTDTWLDWYLLIRI